jgi:diacylglycerol kinase (ATP)
MTTALLYNPVAGRGRARGAIARVLREARVVFEGVELFETKAPGDGVRLGREAAELGFKRLIVVGGDGTVHEAANGVLTSAAVDRPLLSVIPVGTGNDFAKLIGTSGMGAARAVRALAKGVPARFDVGEAWGEYFVNTLGLGLDYEVPFHLQSVKRVRGTPAYAIALFKALRGYREIPLKVRIGDVDHDGRWLTVAVGIGPIEGGGFHLMPGALPDDGLFDICAIRPASLLRIMLLVPLVMLAKHTRLREVHLARATSVMIRGETPLRLHADGELRSPGHTELTISLHAGVLPVLKVG